MESAVSGGVVGLGGLLPGDEARGVCEVVEGLVWGLSLSSGVCSL